MYVESLFTNIMEVLKDFNKLGLPEGTELFLQANLFCHYMKLWSVIEKKENRCRCVMYLHKRQKILKLTH